MINSLEFVEEQGYAEVPEADAEYDVATATDLEGPGDISVGRRHDQGDEHRRPRHRCGPRPARGGKTLDDFDAFFAEVLEGEGPPEKGVAGRASGRIWGDDVRAGAGCDRLPVGGVGCGRVGVGEHD
ncbi:MAG TPA: hypothetical protein VGR26_13900 [Acidimicrobiales bacterium]|nr:hypothetical protein [Acidimicrobiales bacterium]